MSTFEELLSGDVLSVARVAGIQASWPSQSTSSSHTARAGASNSWRTWNCTEVMDPRLRVWSGVGAGGAAAARRRADLVRGAVGDLAEEAKENAETEENASV